MRFFVHSSAARGRRWMKLKSNEFEPRWVITAKCHQNRSTRSGWTGEDTEQTDTSTDNKGRLRRLELSGAREPTNRQQAYSSQYFAPLLGRSNKSTTNRTSGTWALNRNVMGSLVSSVHAQFSIRRYSEPRTRTRAYNSRSVIACAWRPYYGARTCVRRYKHHISA